MRQKIMGAIAVGAAILIGTPLLAFGALTRNSNFIGASALVVVIGVAIGAILLSRKS